MRAPEFPADTPWLHTDRPLSLAMLRGHVVVLDFWTYCCINCLHVLPDLAWLEEKYRDEPFLVIGIHSAKFDNEQDIENIKSAIQRYDITHPVAVDRGHQIWQLYTVKAWPSFVVIGPDGRIVDMMSGEGKRARLDECIGNALLVGRNKGLLADRRIEIQPPPHPESLLSFPGKLAHCPDNGRLFVSDTNHHRIVELELMGAERAQITRVIGSGMPGKEDGGFARASFHRPQGMAYHAGKLYVCDTDNHLIREVDLREESVRTIAGNGEQGGYGEKGGPSLSVRLNSPWDAVMANGRLYIAMAGSHQLWQLDASAGMIDVFAGSGRENLWDDAAHEAHLAQPSGIATDGTWLYFADSEASALRRASLADGSVYTLIGSGLFDFGRQDGPFSAARLQHPLGVTYHQGKVYVADTYNHAIRVAHIAEKYMETLVWRPVKDVCVIEEEACAVLPLNEPNDVLVMDDRLYIADTNHHLIRVLDLTTKRLTTLQIEK